MENQGYKEFVERFEHISKTYKDKTAITYMRNDDSKTLFTFGEIFERVCTAKERFADIGLRPGDRVAIVSSQSPFSLIAAISLAYSNISTVMIDVSLPIEEINRILDVSDVRSVFTVFGIFSSLDEALTQNIPIFDITTILKGLSLFDGSATLVKTNSTIDPHQDVIVILYSSGTTASIKGIMVYFATVLEANKLYAVHTGLKTHMTFLNVMPLSHLAGYISAFFFLLEGCEQGFVEDIEPSKLQKSLLVYEPYFFGMVPRVFEVIEQKIRQEAYAKGAVVNCIFSLLLGVSHFFRKNFGLNIGKVLCKSIREKVFGKNIFYLVTGASPSNNNTVKFFYALGLIWGNLYGLTETYAPVTTIGALDRNPIGTVGNVNRFEGINVKIHEPDENGIGEIRVKTVLIMKGYFRDPELTAAAFDEDGYFKTGDLGYIDKRDYLHVTGRMKEAIMLHTGKKVAPTDVDNFYSSLMGDNIFASCGVPNRDGTYDEIHLFVEEGELSADEQQKLRDGIMELSGQTSTLYQLAGLHFIDKIPMTSIKKVKRFQLKEIALAKYNGKQ